MGALNIFQTMKGGEFLSCFTGKQYLINVIKKVVFMNLGIQNISLRGVGYLLNT